MSIEDPAHLVFRERTDLRPPRRRASSWSAGSLLLAVVAAAAFLLLVRAVLDRSAHTAGSSESAVVRAEAAATERLAPLIATDADVAERLRRTRLADLQRRRAEASSMVYRCVASSGAVSFQQQPCGPDQEVTRAIYAPPERAPARPMQLYRLPEADRRAARSSYVAGSTESERDRRKRECAAAKAARDRTLKAVGIARTYDLLQRLDAQVYEACKGL